MGRIQVPVENVAEIVWGALILIYLAGAGRPEYLEPQVLALFGLSGAMAVTELCLRRIRWRWLTAFDTVVWTVLLSTMVAATGGRSSELWPAYILMSLTAPSVAHRFYPYALLAINSLAYAGIYTYVNPEWVPYTPTLLLLRIGMFFLVAYVVDRSMNRERSAQLHALAIARNRVTELVSARDAERRRIAGDIHDWLGTAIIAPMRTLELAERSRDPEQAAVRIREAVESLRRGHEELRRVMENLHPHLLEQMGLADAARAYIAQWGAEHRITSEFQMAGGPEPPSEQGLACYRILQEALNNCAKHADAQTVRIRLSLSPSVVRLEVADDGRGFDVSAVRNGRGLAGMQERAGVFGGSVRVESVPGRGSMLLAELPAQ